MKNIVKPALILTAICLVMTLAVAGVNLLTADTIAANEAKAAQESMNQLIPDVEFTAVKKDGLVCSEAYKAGDKGYIFVSSAIGYGGEVRVMTALDPEGKVIGIIVLACDDETPGLGQNCKNDSFTDQFKGASGSVELTKNGGEIVSITSATYTSAAVKDSVNDALADYEVLKGR